MLIYTFLISLEWNEIKKDTDKQTQGDQNDIQMTTTTTTADNSTQP